MKTAATGRNGTIEQNGTNVAGDSGGHKNAGSPGVDVQGVDVQGVRSGIGTSGGAELPLLSGRELRALMREHRVTIRELSRRTGVTQKRIRERLRSGISQPAVIRDWGQSIIGHDPGPV